MSNTIQIWEEKQIKKVTKSKKKTKSRNNVIFDELIENSINKVDVKIVTTRKPYLKRSLRPKRKKQFDNGAIPIKKKNVD